MDFRVCLCLFILSSSWCCTARELTAQNILVTETNGASVLGINNLQEPRQSLEEINGNEQLCTLCEEYTAKAINYLENNKTKTEIVELLHKYCLKMPFYKQECVVLVDHYAPVFFLEINKIKPEEFCREKFGRCEKVVSLYQVTSGKNCDICQQLVKEVELKLKDPDTQLELLEKFLKACGAVKKYAKQCKRLVFEFAPVILANTEEFLEKNDVCAILHACEPAENTKEQALLKMQSSLHSSS